jgi:hypothetical protein
MLQALVNECYVDKVDILLMKHLLNGDLIPLFKGYDPYENWEYWRFSQKQKDYNKIFDYDRAIHITDENNLPLKLNEFMEQFKAAFYNAGFNNETFGNRPAPTKQKRRGYNN